MARLITWAPEYPLDPLAEAVAMLDFTDSGQFEIQVPPPSGPPRKSRAATLDKSPDSLVLFWNADCG